VRCVDLGGGCRKRYGKKWMILDKSTEKEKVITNGGIRGEWEKSKRK
jgi:hypothetical protein